MGIRVPVYQQSVKQGAAPNVRNRDSFDANDFGGQRAEALGNLAGGVERLASGAGQVAARQAADDEKVRREQEKARVDSVMTDLVNARHEYLNDKDSGYTRREGEYALAEHAVYLERFDAKLKEASKKLKPDELARHKHMLDRERLSFVESLDRHASGQADALKSQRREGLLAASMSDATGMAAAGEYDKVDDAVGRGLGSIDESARVEGWDPAFADAKRLEYSTKAHIAALQVMVPKDPAAASAYLARNRGAIEAGALLDSKIEKMLGASTLNAKAQAIADGALAATKVAPIEERRAASKEAAKAGEAPVWVVGEGDYLAADEAIRAMDIPQDLKDEALERNRQAHSSRASLREGMDKQPLGRLRKDIANGVPINRAANIDYQGLSDDGKAEVEERIDARRREMEAQGTKDRNLQDELDEELLWKFRSMPLENRVGLDPGTDRAFASGSAQLRYRIQAEQQGDKKEWDKDRGVSLDGFMARARKSAPATKTDNAKFLSDAKDRYYKKLLAAGDRPLKEDEVLEVLSETTKEWIVKGRVYGTNVKPAYKIRPDDEVVGPANGQTPPAQKPPAPPADVLDVSLISAEDRKHIIDLYKQQKGRLPTDEEIMALHIKRRLRERK